MIRVGHGRPSLAGSSARPVGQSIVGVKSLVDHKYDPVIESIFPNDRNARDHDRAINPRIISAQRIHLVLRDRVKLSGKAFAGGLGGEHDFAEIQLVYSVQRSLGEAP